MKSDVRSMIALSFSSLASGCTDSIISIWNTTNDTLIKELKGHTSWVISLALISKDLLASGSYNKEIFIWDLIKGEKIKQLNGSTGEVKALVTLTENRLASISNDKILIWDLNSGNILIELIEENNFPNVKLTFKCLVRYLDSYLISANSNNGIITIWDINKGIVNKTIDIHATFGIYSLAVLENDLIASGSSDKTIKIWNINSNQIIKTLKGHQGAPGSLLALPNNKLATGSTKDFLIFDIQTEKSFKLLSNESQVDINSLVLLEDKKRFTSGFKNSIIIWSLKI